MYLSFSLLDAWPMVINYRAIVIPGYFRRALTEAVCPDVARVGVRESVQQ